jgi:HSP20 family protein
MAIKDLIPWNNNKSREVGTHRGSDIHPFFTLHREMNRMFDDVFRDSILHRLIRPGH